MTIYQVHEEKFINIVIIPCVFRFFNNVRLELLSFFESFFYIPTTIFAGSGII